MFVIKDSACTLRAATSGTVKSVSPFSTALAVPSSMPA